MGIEHWLLKAGFYCASEAFRRIESLEEVERVAGIELLMDTKVRMSCRCVGARAAFAPGIVGYKVVIPPLGL